MTLSGEKPRLKPKQATHGLAVAGVPEGPSAARHDGPWLLPGA